MKLYYIFSLHFIYFTTLYLVSLNTNNALLTTNIPEICKLEDKMPLICKEPLTPDSEHNKALIKYLTQIHVNQAEIKKKESRVNLQIVEQVIKSLINAMKKTNKLFNDLYQREVYTGSYWDGVRVKSPTEFDLNMVLRLPFRGAFVEIVMNDEAPAFLQYHLKRGVTEILSRNNDKWIYQQKLDDFFDENNNLLRPKVKSWIQSVISTAMQSRHFKKPKEVKTISPSGSGPAFTYYLTTTGGTKIDVDLVPVFDGSKYPLPKKIHKSKRFMNLHTDHQNLWFMVPKPYTAKGRENPDTYWRISFPEAEKNLLPSQGCVKKLIKLFKLLRDKQKWDKIASYYIKTLFLLQLDKEPNPKYWNEKYLGSLFMKMLKKFQTALEKERLSYYFNREANLLSSVKHATLYNYSSSLKKIIKKLTVSPDHIMTYFAA